MVEWSLFCTALPLGRCGRRALGLLWRSCRLQGKILRIWWPVWQAWGVIWAMVRPSTSLTPQSSTAHLKSPQAFKNKMQPLKYEKNCKAKLSQGIIKLCSCELLIKKINTNLSTHSFRRDQAFPPLPRDSYERNNMSQNILISKDKVTWMQLKVKGSYLILTCRNCGSHIAR